MAWFNKPKNKKEQIEEQRRRRRGDSVAMSVPWLNFRILMGTFAFVLMAWAMWFICFAGLSPVTQQIVASQRERVRVVAAFSFKYTSEVDTQRAKKLAGELVGPIFKEPDTAHEQQMKQAVLELESALEQYRQDTAGLSPEEQAAAREQLARDFKTKHGFDLNPADVEGLSAVGDPKKITQAFGEAMATIHSLVNRGIFDPAQLGIQSPTTQGVSTNVNIAGRAGAAPVLAPGEAQRQFHVSLLPLDVDAPAKAAIYNLFKQALEPNIQFDRERTDSTKAAAIARVPDTVVQVREGEVLADPNAPDYDSAEQREKLQKYFTELRLHGDSELAATQLPSLRLLYTTLLLLAAILFIKSGLGPVVRTPKIYALGATLLLVNLALVRLVVGLGSTGLFTQSPEYLAVLPWLAPTMLAPILATVMMGAGPAVVISLIISMLFSMMTGDTLEIFLFSFLASLVAVYFSRDVRLRAKLVRAGLLGGAAAAVCAVYLWLVNQSLTPADMGRQMFVAMFTGLLTAVAAIGLLPVCENLFKITTDITLLELTDYNHPLLRKLQMSAPGSYHHSLMVANLAERAAMEIGANPLMCRVCALYHDIGKIVKPEYFTENQRDGFNPHEGVSPSMSALIIKSHITEGLGLAKQNKLPQVLRDIIAQHHGTTLIKFFYHKATKQQRLLTNSPFNKQRQAEPGKALSGEKAPERNEPGVDESSYRYDGPKPNFKESAIVALADCIEAASRSLRKVTPQSVEELVESIIEDRIEDHQLDDSPITMLELKRIKESFTLTLLNMLHSRISYPGQEEAEPAARTEDKNIVPMTPPSPPTTTGAPNPAANGPASSASA